MVDQGRTPTDEVETSAEVRFHRETALAQLEEESRFYNRAVGSYNTHLHNHRDRRELDELPYRRPITAHEAFVDAANGELAALKSLLTWLLDEAHRDSRLRRHPRVHRIHREAVAHLEIARREVISTLEELVRMQAGDADVE